MESQRPGLPARTSFPLERLRPSDDGTGVIVETFPKINRKRKLIYYEVGNSLQEEVDREQIKDLYKAQSIEKESKVLQTESVKPFVNPDPGVPPTRPGKTTDDSLPPPAPPPQQSPHPPHKLQEPPRKKRKTAF